MKKIKLLVLLFTVSVGIFYSCSDSNPVGNESNASKSIALRTTLNALKKANNIGGKSALDQSTCFNFVFPLTLSYNNGTLISVASYEGLIEILTNETNELYIDGIVFPFAVQEENTVTNIANEAEFYALISQCTFPSVNDCVFDLSCYGIVYPISIINANNETVVIHNQDELMQVIADPTGTNAYQLNIVFPISVIQNNQTIVINDLYAFFALNNACGGTDCYCTEDYTPVCVQTPGGIVQYSNICHATCDGYTAADIVDCSGINPNPCICPAVFAPVCVQTPTGIVQFENACRAECEGFTEADFVDCNTGGFNFLQQLGSCFTFVYPIEVEYQGAVVTVHNDGELVPYCSPNGPAYPPIHFPVTVTFIPSALGATVNNQASLEFVISQHCN